MKLLVYRHNETCVVHGIKLDRKLNSKLAEEIVNHLSHLVVYSIEVIKNMNIIWSEYDQ